MKFVEALLAEHLRRYPEMQLADAYKLLHQAALGPGHAIELPSAQEHLTREILATGDGPTEPMLDPISPDGQLVRVHLRAYVRAGNDLGALAEAFVRTARDFPPSRKRLERLCTCLGDLASAPNIPFAREETVGYLAQIAATGYRAVHHSEAYHSLYRPAYRVVLAEYLSKACVVVT